MATYSNPARYYWSYVSTYTRDDVSGILDHGSSSGNGVLGIDVRTLTPNPGWRVKVSKHQDASSPYKLVKRILIPGRLMCQAWGIAALPRTMFSSNYSGVCSYNPFSFIDTSDRTDPVLLDQAVASIKRKLRRNVGNMNLAVPVAELGEMRGLIRSLADKGMGQLNALADIQRKRGPAKMYKWFADSWLTFSFGVRPMISEIQDLDKAISSYILREDRSIRLSSQASRKWVSGARTKSTGAFGADLISYTNAFHDLSYRVTAGFNLPLSSSNNYGVLDHLGLELGSLPAIGWELTPYSWVLDYFGTIGAYMDDTFSAPFGNTTYVTSSRRYTIEMDTYHGFLAPTKYTKHVYSKCSPTKSVLVTFQRDVLSALPRAQLRFRTVDEIGKNAVTKLLNLASLGIMKFLR